MASWKKWQKEQRDKKETKRLMYVLTPPFSSKLALKQHLII